MTNKHVSWFALLIWLPTLLVLMVITKLLWGKWEKATFEKMMKLMQNTTK